MLIVILFVVNEYDMMYYIEMCYLIIDNLTNSYLSAIYWAVLYLCQR